MDVERRKAWNELRSNGDAEAAKKFKGTRWCLRKNPANLDEQPAATQRRLRRRGGDVWRAYTFKEAFREIFSGDLAPDQAAGLIDRWVSRASRSRPLAFVKTAKTIRKHRDGILAALRLGIMNRNKARGRGIRAPESTRSGQRGSGSRVTSERRRWPMAARSSLDAKDMT